MAWCAPRPGVWESDGRPKHLRQTLEGSLQRLGLERIDLYQLHRIDPRVPVDDQLGELAALQKEGKIASVQNLYNLTNRQSEDVLEYATAGGIGFIPWFPLATGELAEPGSVLAEEAKEHDATPAQLALAWLLHRSPVTLPIPGTSSVAHLKENLAAADITLTDENVAALTSLA